MAKHLNVLPGWDGAFGADFSDFPISGTSCGNCRSLVIAPPELRCANPTFVAQSIPSQGKRAGDPHIPVRNNSPFSYCCNVWALDSRWQR
jgi:hypothetical protein